MPLCRECVTGNHAFNADGICEHQSPDRETTDPALVREIVDCTCEVTR